MISLALVALLVAASAAFVALPLLRGRAAATPARVDAPRLELLERRDRALATLKELELELRAGTLAQADHDALAVPLRAEALAAIAALEGR